MNKTVQTLEVIANKSLNKDHVLLELKSEVILSGIMPGQFANILAGKSAGIFLRRPFSIYKVDYHRNTISFLIKVIGEGTRSLAKVQPGDSLSVIYPLGNGYTIPVEKSRVLLVGGGVGLASLMMLAESLYLSGHQVEILIGARSATDLVELDSFGRFGTVHTTTEDGSQGVKGYVTSHPLLANYHPSSFQKLFTCGPEAMMKAVAKLAFLHGIPCEVSLENTMACGYGVCLCCVTETTDGHKCVCTEGPIFDLKRLKWQN